MKAKDIIIPLIIGLCLVSGIHIFLFQVNHPELATIQMLKEEKIPALIILIGSIIFSIVYHNED